MSGIKVGDLVVVIKPQPCCGRTDSIGYIFVVAGLDSEPGGCSACGEELAALGLLDPADGMYVMASRCIVIPPLPELEDIKHEEEITV